MKEQTAEEILDTIGRSETIYYSTMAIARDLSTPRDIALKAMDTYATQQVEAFKKRLIEKLTQRHEQEYYEGGDWFAGFYEAVEIVKEENK